MNKLKNIAEKKLDYPIVHEFQVEHHYFSDHQKMAKYQIESLSREELDRDWNLDDFFGTIFVINLPEAEERLISCCQALSKIGVTHFEVLPAINGRKDVNEELWKKMDRNWAKIDTSTEEGQRAFDNQRKAETGCYLSHWRVIQIIKERYEQAQKDLYHAQSCSDYSGINRAIIDLKKYRSVLILEDDNAFGIVNEDKFSARLDEVGLLFRKAMLSLPRNWDMLYFMALSKEPEEVITPYMVRLSHGICLNAYAVNHTMYDAIIEQLKKIEDPDVKHVDPVDNELAYLHKKFRCYAINPSIAYQGNGLSSITSKSRKTYRQTQPIYLSKESFKN